MTIQREDTRGSAIGTVAAADDTTVSDLRARVTGDLLDIVVDLDSGAGCRLRDLRDGTEYLDMTMFFSSAPLGHGHPGLRTPDFEAALVRAGRVKPANPDFATVEQARFAETSRRAAPSRAIRCRCCSSSTVEPSRSRTRSRSPSTGRRKSTRATVSASAGAARCTWSTPSTAAADTRSR